MMIYVTTKKSFYHIGYKCQKMDKIKLDLDIVHFYVPHETM